MKKISLFIASILFASAVFASCPIWKPYGCVMMPNGKMLCGCGIGS